MKSKIFKATSRGHEQHGWLDAKHTFSFANYYDADRIHFGALRVLNDDTIEGGKGFGSHPHDNMEIVTIPLKGSLCHQDSLGHQSIIRPGEVQVMSAGTGIVHSEFNAEESTDLNLFQIWIISKHKNVKPRYQQADFDFLTMRNKLNELVSPKDATDGLWIHQDAWISRGIFDQNTSFTYQVKKAYHGVFAMSISGNFKIDDMIIEERDAIAIEDVDVIEFIALSPDADLLLIEVPMRF